MGNANSLNECKATVLKTRRFYFRTLKESDASKTYLSWLHDPEISKMLLTDTASYTILDLKNFILEHDNKTKFLFGIFSKDGSLIGTHSLKFFPDERYAGFGVMIGDREYWGESVPLETRECVLRWAFKVLKCERVIGMCLSINRASIFNYKIQGWRRDYVEKKYCLIDGDEVDMIHFSLTSDDFTKLMVDSDSADRLL